MLGFNIYQELQDKADLKTNAREAFTHVEPGQINQTEQQPWEDGMQYEPLTGNLGYLINSGIKAFESVGRAGALMLGEYEAAATPGKIRMDDSQVHAATRTIGDIGSTLLPFMVPGIGLATGTAAITANTGIESVEAGMDATTAGVRAGMAGTTAAAMGFVAPLSGKALDSLFTGGGTKALLEVSKSAGLNVGLGVAQRGADWAIVKQKYPEFADKLEIVSAQTVGVDLALWGLFAGLGYRQVRQQLVEAGVPLTKAAKAIRAAEEVLQADTAINDAVYVRRANRIMAEEGPLESAEVYQQHAAMAEDAIQRIEQAEPVPMDAPPTEVPLRQDNIKAELKQAIDGLGLDTERVVLHDEANPIPENVLRAAKREGGDLSNTEAWMDNGVLHINMDAANDIGRIKDVVGFHEITHAGQDVELLTQAHAAIAGSKGSHSDFLRSEILRLAQERGYDLGSKEGTDKAVKEATAEAMTDAVFRGKVADVMNESYFAGLINKAKQFLRDRGLKIDYTDEDAARLIGQMWLGGKQKMAALETAPNQWKTIYEGLQNETYTRTGNSKGKYYTESDFQNHLKEFYPSVYSGMYGKADVMAVLKNMADGSSRSLTDKQKEIKANFEYDLEAYQSRMADPVEEVDLPFSIAHKTDTPEFKAWFGDSKVVDEQGRPLVLYHGTDADILMFDAQALGKSTGAASANMGHFFVNSSDVARTYADYAATVAPVRRMLAEAYKFEKRGDWDAYDSAVERAERLESEITAEPARGQNIVPVYLKMSNPAIMDAKGEFFTALDNDIKKFISSAKRKGHDGVIIKNLDDAAGRVDLVADHYVVFDSTSIKSVTGNRGTFDPADPRIDFSIAHAAPYLRELDAALAKRGAEGEHAILDDPKRGRREVITEIKRNGKVIGYQARQLDRTNQMYRSKVDSALPEGESMGVLSEIYRMEDRFSKEQGLDLNGTYVSDITKALAEKGGALPTGESERILSLKNGTEKGNAYPVTPDDMRVTQTAKENTDLVKRYENFLDQRLNERAAANERRLETLGFRTTEDGGLRRTDAGSNQSVDTVRRDDTGADLTSTQQLDAAMSSVNAVDSTDVDFSIQHALPETGGSTGRSNASESYLKRLVELTENQITKDEAAQIAGTVADRYKYLQRRMTDGEIDLLTEFKRMGIDPFIKANKEEYMAMTDAERKWALTKAELMATLTDKKEGFRRQEISAKKLEEIKQVAAQHQQETGRNSIETMIDVLMGDPSGKGSLYPWKNKSMGISHEYLAMLKDGIKDFDSWMGMRMSAADEAVLAREILKPGSTGNAQMKNAAEHVRKTFDAMRTRANKAGADIGHIEDYFPQQWNSRQVMLFGMKPADIIKGFKNQAEAIAQSKQAWVDFMMDRVDRKAAQYIDETGQYFDDARMRQFLEYSFDTLSTNGANKGTAPGKAGLANRMSKERQLFFKDADSWLEANRLFGSNDLLTGIMNHTERTAKDISLLEMFGPNPDRVYQQLKSEALQQNVGQAWMYNRKLNFADALWMEVTGSRQTAGTGMLADGMAAVRQSMVFSRLGSALLSQLGDLPIFHALATKSDLPGVRTITEIARTLNPANSGDRTAADLLEFGVSALHDDVMSRVMDTTNGKGISAKAAQFTMRAGGMNWWADRMSSGAKLLLARGMADMSAQRFADLSPGNKALVKRSGITEAEWNQQIQGNQSIMADYNGRDVLAPSLIKDQALREKVWGLIERESTFMALRPDEKTQALIKGTRERGTASSEIVNSMFLFRSFTAAMIQKVAPRILASLPGESRSKWMYTAGSFMIASTLMAAMSTQLKEINKGRMPRDMKDPRFWGQAFGQAWNLGVIGDLLWGENNRFGQNVTSTISGPVAGLLEDTYKVTFGNIQKAASGDDIDPLADAVKMTKNYATPNLWYLRPALDQFLWWPLQEMANPGYLQRSQDRIERENKTKHWLPPTGAQRY